MSLIGVLLTGLLATAALCLGLWVASRTVADVPLPPSPNAPPAPRRAGRAGERAPRFVGVVVAGEAVDVESRAEGRLLEVSVKVGERVARGADLARVDVEPLQKDLLAAEAALRDARRRLARRLRYATGGAFTMEELDSHRREAIQEQARVDQLARSVADGRVKAPFAGSVVEQYLAPGALAGPGRPLVRLARRGEAHVRFAIPEEQAAAVRVGDTVTIQVQAGGLELLGTVTGLSPEVDASSRMIYGAASLLDSNRAQRAQLTTGLIVRVTPAPLHALEQAGERAGEARP
jgi:RND family efflux transporter MFP subunit